MIRLRRFFHIIGVLLAVFLVPVLSGCSAVKLGYNNAPELSYWWLDSYLDFDDAQSLKLRADLTALQTWHRQSQLPAYVGTLKKLQGMAPANVTPDQVCEVASTLKTYLAALVDQIEPTGFDLAPTLKPEQVNHLARQFDKRNLKWRAEWTEGTPAERNARRLKQLTDRVVMLYGKLDEPQLALLRASVATSAFDASLTHRENLRRQQDALQTLRQLPGGTPEIRVKAEVRALLERTLASPDAAYRNHAEKITLESCKTFAALHNSTTPVQRLQVLETLKDYEADAKVLMATKP